MLGRSVHAADKGGEYAAVNRIVIVLHCLLGQRAKFAVARCRVALCVLQFPKHQYQGEDQSYSKMLLIHGCQVIDYGCWS